MDITSSQYDAACRILSTLRANGHEAYLAGGCVRDLLLGHPPKDYDVATSATPDVVLHLFPRTFAVGAHFGVVRVCDEKVEDAAAADPAATSVPQVVTEVATFRSDGAYSDGRRPDAVQYTASAEEDVQRRDFTINGLLLDPLESPHDLRTAVVDYVGGIADLERGVVRAIGRADPPPARCTRSRPGH